MADEMMHDAAEEARRESPPPAATVGGEQRLSQLADYEVRPDFHDIRGWAVRGSTGRDLGIVGELLVDTSALEVSAIEVHLGVGPAAVRGNVVGSARVPIENVQIRPDRYVVVDVDVIPCDDVVLLDGVLPPGGRVPCGQIGIRRRDEGVATAQPADVEIRRDAQRE